jgi:hypothetical protein
MLYIRACPKIGMKRNLGMTVSDQLICLYFILRHHVVEVANDLYFSIDVNPDSDNIAYRDKSSACIFKLLRSQGIDSKESIPPHLRSLAGLNDNPISTRFLAPINCSKITAQ